MGWVEWFLLEKNVVVISGVGNDLTLTNPPFCDSYSCSHLAYHVIHVGVGVKICGLGFYLLSSAAHVVHALSIRCPENLVCEGTQADFEPYAKPEFMDPFLSESYSLVLQLM